MVLGDIISVSSGILSGAAVAAYLNTLNLDSTNASGSRINIIEMGNGQVIVNKLSVTGW